MKDRRNRQEPPSDIVLPITPMLDMAFQLLFFFLATFSPSDRKEGQMDLSLPAKQSEVAAKTPDKVKPIGESHKEDIDIPAEVTITLRGHKEPRLRGELSALTITTKAGDEELKGSKEVRDFALDRRLKEIKPKDLKDKDGKPRVPVVRVKADPEMRWEEVMSVMDVCYYNEFQVSFAKPDILGGGQ